MNKGYLKYNNLSYQHIYVLGKYQRLLKQNYCNFNMYYAFLANAWTMCASRQIKECLDELHPFDSLQEL